MTLQKRLDYGFNGYEAPPVPRAARSARRHSFKKKADEFQMCAFDLLATVAGKLLLDGENPPPNTPGKDQSMTVGNSVGKEEKEEDKPPEDRDCYERNFLITEIVSEAPNPNHSPNKLACNQNAVMASCVTSSDGSEKIGSAEQLVNDDCKLSLGISTPSVDIESSGFRFSAHSGSDDDSRKDVKPDSATIRNLSISRKAPQFGSGHTEASDRKSSALVCLVDSVKFPFCRDGSFPVNGDNVKLVTKDDDDENSSECMELTTRNKAFKPPGDRRFRKFLAPNDCKVTSDDEGFTERCSYDRKNGVKRQRPLRPLRDYPFKKRKLYDCSTASNSDESITADGNGKNEDGIGYIPATPAAIAAPPTSAGGGYASFHSRNSQVKLRIKSFRVPELFIEIPESATVGSLKRMVMESVNTVLGDGLRVGVILQGKKIRDDSKTLLQSGIAHDKKLDTLGFSLERSLAPAPAPIRSYPEDCPSPMVCENPQPLARHPSTPIITENGGQQGSQEIHLNNFIESDHDSAPSPPGIPLQKQDALAIVPLRKSKRSESTQRRIRRPFTVSEVEALVQAVEKLGTGRWRDVKLRAFDNAKHRTYVDLKDKWKTLVHTAGISPQQRRGEPVPQELLDRVLTAHAYWSHHQPKHHLNSHPLSALFL